MTEAEVQSALRRWFRDRGYSVSEKRKLAGGNKIDLVAESEQSSWYVEVNGDYDTDPAQYNTNFDTGIGLLVKGMTRLDNRTEYAIAILVDRTGRGENLSYRLALPKYSRTLAFGVLNIHLMLMHSDESVDVVEPAGVRAYLASVNPSIRAR